MPLLMFGAIVGCGLLFYASYRYARSQPPAHPAREEDETPKQIAKGD